MIRRRVSLLFFAGCALLGAVLAGELSSGTGGERSTIEIAPRIVRIPRAPPEQIHRQAQLVAAILARPLFSPDRRPPEKSASGSQADADLANTRLTGIVTLPDLRLAIFAVPQGKPLVLKPGETVSGWQIDRITPDMVAISGPGGSRNLQPKSDSSLARVPTTLGAFPRVAQPVPKRPAVPFLPRPPVQPPAAVGPWRR